MRRAGWLALLGALALPAANARAEELMICYNYGCYARAPVDYGDERLDHLQQEFAEAGDDAIAGRAAISLVVGLMYALEDRLAGRTPRVY